MTPPSLTLPMKEAEEFVRTWRAWVLWGFILFFAITSPLLAKITPELIGSLVGTQPGVVIQLPDPTWRDSYAQWIKNLSQIGAFVVLIVGAGMVAQERASGTAVLVLAKPVSRAWFVSAKAAALAVFVLVGGAVGTAIVQAETYLLFDSAPAAVLWEATGVWLLSAFVLIATMTLLSSAVSTLAAAGCGIGAYLVISVLTISPAITEHSFVGLFSAPAAMVAGTEPALGWPIATGVALIAVLIGAAIAVFGRREL
ncbi:MAG: ABC transporter permease [Coriobacteriia bacterium]